MAVIPVAEATRRLVAEVLVMAADNEVAVSRRLLAVAWPKDAIARTKTVPRMESVFFMGFSLCPEGRYRTVILVQIPESARRIEAMNLE